MLADPTLAFLHPKVESIDESDAKYHRKPKKAPSRKAPTANATTSNNKKKRSASVAAATTTKKKNRRTVEAHEEVGGPLSTMPPSLAIEEDDNYDESDSE